MAMSSSNEASAEAAAASSSTSDGKPAGQPDEEVPLTYYGSIHSPAYKHGWECLQAGAFEDGLEAAETGLQETKARLLQSNAIATESDAELHESMAPFFYLYGTTLLYSVEEQTSEQLATLTTVEAPAAPEETAASGSDGSAAPEPTKEEYADDLEIAWDNLEVARAILERMLAEADSTEQSINKDKIQMDLAQVCLREGDLQRINGRYEDAIRDFERSLELRTATSMVGPYDRQIADVHMTLGAVYSLLVSSSSEAESEQGSNAANPKELEQKLRIWRSRSFHHTFLAGKTLCGQVATMSNVDPAEFLQQVEGKVPSFKSTGLEQHEEDMEHPTTLGLKLKLLRDHASKFQPMEGNEERFSVVMDLLDEIQETIDEGEAGEEGVQKVQQMKAEITAAIAGQQDEPTNGGAITTVGFGSEAALATAASAQPIASMMVKKKKKRDANERNSENEPPTKQSKVASE